MNDATLARLTRLLWPDGDRLDGPQVHWLLRRGWGNAWGIFTVAPPDVTLVRQRLHFKKLLRVQTEDGRQLAFRYYDPRVLNSYLPTCTGEEVQAFLGPVTRLLAEDGAAPLLHAFDAGGATRHGLD